MGSTAESPCFDEVRQPQRHISNPVPNEFCCTCAPEIIGDACSGALIFSDERSCVPRKISVNVLETLWLPVQPFHRLMR